ncbi:hypothetical protein [Rhizobium sp. SSA_523]|uniref:hypothetical protein n=1 Tax=Rhizobium sp. SSA_523 TaxID=2952477 RepID=UPI00209164AC|nr:hypothetical protein [Rhizobium sp. SSA_523]MCO5730203.1 hypothetical protein [Rhizobium sp. SSA_523]WKC25264.1 hypothetical protein QTJ18_14875 [Rhizobium sp. SSA_523]
MTFLLDHRLGLSRRHTSSRLERLAAHVTALLSPLLSAFEQWRTTRTRARTLREIEALPFDVRKDIGWPSDADQPRKFS